MKEKFNSDYEIYKKFSKSQLKKEIVIHNFLIIMNDDFINFIVSLILILTPSFIFYGISFSSFLVLTLIHFIFVWLLLVKKYNFKLISDKDKNELEEVLLVLNQLLKEKE